MRKILLSTVSYPVMNLVLALFNQSKARDTDEYRELLKNQMNMRYKAIFRGLPYQPMFS